MVNECHINNFYHMDSPVYFHSTSISSVMNMSYLHGKCLCLLISLCMDCEYPKDKVIRHYMINL